MMDYIMPIEHDFKVISVDKNALTSETKNIIAERQVWMDTDAELREHIYDLDFTLEELKNPQIQAIYDTCEKRNAAYFRLVDM